MIGGHVQQARRQADRRLGVGPVAGARPPATSCGRRSRGSRRRQRSPPEPPWFTPRRDEADVRPPPGSSRHGRRVPPVGRWWTRPPARCTPGSAICELDAGGDLAAARALATRRALRRSRASRCVDTRRAVVRLRPGDYGHAPGRRPARAGATRATTARDGPRCSARSRGPRTTATRTSCRPCAERDPVAGRRPRPADAVVRPHRPRRTWTRPSRRQDLLARVGEHAHRAARLQRHHREDDGRLGPRAPSCPRCSWSSTNPTASPGRTTTRSRRRTCILEGETEATFDGETYQPRRGDVAWAGVGCVHAFRNPGPGRVRWLETQAPQPPARHSYRFARDWDVPARAPRRAQRTGRQEARWTTPAW